LLKRKGLSNTGRRKKRQFRLVSKKSAQAFN